MQKEMKTKKEATREEVARFQSNEPEFIVTRHFKDDHETPEEIEQRKQMIGMTFYNLIKESRRQGWKP